MCFFRLFFISVRLCQNNFSTQSDGVTSGRFLKCVLKLKLSCHADLLEFEIDCFVFSFQVLQQRLDQATRSRIFLNKKLDKSKEDIDDLKFRVSNFGVIKMS